MTAPLPSIGRRATLLALLGFGWLGLSLLATPAVRAQSAAVSVQPLAAAAAMSTAPQSSAPQGASAQPSAPQGADAKSGAVAPAAPSKAAAPAGADQQPTPAEQALALDDDPPTRVRVAVLNASGKAGGANTVALLLGDYKRRALEDQLGLQIELVNLSTADLVRPGRTVIYYRPEFLRAALIMARAIPGEQYIAPMRPLELKKAGMDVEIVVGTELP